MDRDKVIKCLTDIENIMIARQEFCPREELQYWIELQEGVADALALLKEQETVEPKQGKWIYCEDASGQDGFKCSECGFFEPWYYDFENHNFITDYAYCPSCGKPMQEGR